MWSPFFLWTFCVLVSPLLLVPAQGKPLVPFRSAPRVLPRSTWKREVIPKDVVTLSYAPEGAHYSTSSLTFSAYKDVPLLPLEDMEYLVERIICHVTLGAENSVVEIAFISQDAYAVAAATWSSLFKFILVTSHSGCNPHDQRAAWLVSSVFAEDFNTISLEVVSVPLGEIGASLRISHTSDNVSAGWGSRSAPQLQRRDVDDIYPINKTFDFEPRQQLIPVDSSLLGISSSSDSLLDPANLQVFCVDCVSALDFSIGVEIEYSFHDINLEISLNDSHTFTTEFDVITVPIPELGFSFTDVTLGFFWGGAIKTDLTIAGAVNFTVGASAHIPTGATATFVATNLDQSSASGWDKSTFDIHPFRLNSGSFSVTAGVSLSPFIDATIAFGSGSGSTARLYLDTPHMSGVATIAANVNRECQTLGPDDFESFADAVTFGAGLNISLEGNSSGALFPNDDKVLLTLGLPFGDLPTIDDPACMVFAEDGSGGNSLLPASTGTLVAASSAIPTFNIPGIESYYSAHGTLPTNVNYIQMISATTVPSDILAAVQQAAAAEEPHKHHSKVGAIVGGVIGGLAIIFLAVFGLWYLRFRRREPVETVGGWAPEYLPKTGALTPGSQLEGKDYVSQR
ncbi:hypothetical protein K438DRAFT_2024955 [Mycena galopus ATCC 62051]|nr:hypothetical protein K438DRAFT_2024955 [Mycena galopus ATCC 62051]